MGALSLSGKSLVGRLMLAFSLLALLLLMLVSLGSVSLYWVKAADKYLYEEALPASEAARQLMQSVSALQENAQALERAQEEAERAFLGRKLSIESSNLLGAIARLKSLNLQGDSQLGPRAAEIIHDLTQLGHQVGERLALAKQLRGDGQALVDASGRAIELLEAELAVVDSAVLAKLSLAYPEVAGTAQSGYLLDTIIEKDLDIQARLNRALALIHHLALVGQLLQSPEQHLGLSKVLVSMSRVLTEQGGEYRLQPTEARGGMPGNELASATSDVILGINQPNLMPLELLKGVVRDPVRATELAHELAILRGVGDKLTLQRRYAGVLASQTAQLQTLSDKLSQLNTQVDAAMTAQQSQAEQARGDFLRQLFWAKAGLWGTGLLMLVLILLVVYRVIYKGIALRLHEATDALSRLSRGDTQVALDPHGDDELTAMASAIDAFKQKTDHNQRLQSELQETASELSAHKASLETTVQERTQELAQANRRLDAEVQGHAQARQMAEAADKAKSLFLATMSHEIRTPLNGLLGTLTLLGESELPTAQKQMLALSQYSGALLQTVLNDILDFSRLEQGKLSNEPRPVAINELLDEVVSIMLAGAGNAGLSLRLERDRLPEWINIDGPKLRQVLFNLLGNAIKFTPTGEICLRVSQAGARLKFTVSDTGLGIPEDAKARLFIAYSAQPNQGRSRGTGLGLAISKELVTLMGAGDEGLWVETEVNKGSTFGFSLPSEACEAPVLSATDIIPQVAPKRVLVVEDNQVNAMVAQGFLAHLGHEAVLAPSCAEAMAVFEDKDAGFDAVMLDIQLSDGSGIDLLSQLRERAASDVLFAAFTAQLQPQDLEVYREVGFDEILAKPLNMQALMCWLGRASKVSAPVAKGSEEAEETQEAEAVVLVESGETSAEAIEKNDPLLNAPLLNAPLLDAPLLDKAQFQGDLDCLGEAAMAQMLSLYLSSSEAQLTKLEQLVESTPEQKAEQKAKQADDGKNEVCRKLLHGLKGSSANMGMVRLTRRCQQLEKSELQATDICGLRQLWRDSVAAFEAQLALTQ
ncbi:TMAO reductase system sensor histidine kinase/response regulator TorS [Shewanella aegiceratis]|uniref:TMAO reductase system sensor histidine kinase/response regulator TorS n=1 Tax=Shewanella aegiceratis TaxID=2864203 RepID=UPI001C65E949|nr:TMAO reductase system sensor histidine kinase/response regulator TorS [Shewanella aegiceratis]QYJ81476.1 TMAO reductase system sensor histidine kinase/response regulator TorS [Shewanella aegiceratis]